MPILFLNKNFLNWILLKNKESTKSIVTLVCSSANARLNIILKCSPHWLPVCFIGLLALKEPVTAIYYVLAQKNRTYVKTSGKCQKSSIGDWLCTKPFLPFQKQFWGWKDISDLKSTKRCKEISRSIKICKIYCSLYFSFLQTIFVTIRNQKI